MDIAYLKKKIKLDRKKKARNDFLLKLFICIFVVGYVFFFLSNYFFPKVYKNIKITDIGTNIDLEDYIFTLDTWDYAKKDKAFEVIFSVQNLSFDKNPKYEFTLKENDKVYRGKIKKNIDNKKVIVHFSNISPRWTEITMTINAGGKVGRINMNDKEVNRVRHIKKRSNTEYIIYSNETKIKGLKAHVKKKENERDELVKKSEYAYKKLDELEKKKGSEVGDEIEAGNKNRSKLGLEMENLKGDLDMVMLDIEESKQKIDKLKIENIELKKK